MPANRSLIDAMLAAGTYYVIVRGGTGAANGTFTLAVRRTA